MAATSRTIRQLLRAVWNGYTPTDQELASAEIAVESPETTEQIAGCMICLMSRSERVSFRVIGEKLREVCPVVSCASGDAFFLLTSAIVMLPDDCVARDETLRRFIYRAIFGEYSGARCNATLLLGRLARAGDPISMGLLRVAALDSDDGVASNAKVALAELGENGNGSGDG